jgi:hypothetical protein
MKAHRINRKKLHPLENIVAITIVAIICGMETWAEVALFGQARAYFFSKFFDLKNGTPSKDTFRRFFAALDNCMVQKDNMENILDLHSEVKQKIAAMNNRKQLNI